MKTFFLFHLFFGFFVVFAPLRLHIVFVSLRISFCFKNQRHLHLLTLCRCFHSFSAHLYLISGGYFSDVKHNLRMKGSRVTSDTGNHTQTDAFQPTHLSVGTLLKHFYFLPVAFTHRFMSLLLLIKLLSLFKEKTKVLHTGSDWELNSALASFSPSLHISL